ncbi:Mobile element protein [Pseudohaliea rubra DSM 19751]|uniref:Mobile element protein n=1 Tax=Pseudohaliea rubra DSM 19751 TaxID=1265313 RepID=A0A095VW73_9GAMM|nr:Mobile element protein [Pseudohaliea rubra DSM 19751]
MQQNFITLLQVTNVYSKCNRTWIATDSSLRSGQRAANVMTLIQSAKINGLNPQAHLRDVLDRLPTARQSDLAALLPHNWNPPVNV